MAGVAGGLCLGGLECGLALLRSLSAPAGESLSVSVLAWMVSIDLIFGVVVGFLAGLVAMSTPQGAGPAPWLRRFLGRAPGGPRARVAALGVGAAVFLHGAMALGTWMAGRFHNGTLAALLFLTLAAVTLVPAVAAGRWTERWLAGGRGALANLTVFAVFGTVGAALGPHVDLAEIAALPGLMLVVWASGAAGEEAAAQAAGGSLTALSWVVGGLTLVAALWWIEVPAGLARDLSAWSLVAGWAALL